MTIVIMPPSAQALPSSWYQPRPSPSKLRVALPPPAAVDHLLADSALRALLDEFLTRHGNRVQLRRIGLEEVGGDGAALPETRLTVEGMVLKPVAGGYERVDLSLGYTRRGGFSEGRSSTRVTSAPSGPFFAIDLGLCQTIEALIATLAERGRKALRFHQINFSCADGSKDHPVWTVEYTRGRLLGARREKATIDDVTGECELQLS